MQGSPEVGQVLLGDVKKEDSPSIQFRVSIGSKVPNWARLQVRHMESSMTEIGDGWKVSEVV